MKKKRRVRKGRVAILVFMLIALGWVGTSAYNYFFNPLTQWKLLLVNNDNELSSKYKVKLTELDNMEKVDSRIYGELQEMFNAAEADGIYPVVVSGYRSREEQTLIYENEILKYINQGYSGSDAISEAQKWVAFPGKSEHETGLAVDINSDISKSSSNVVYEWLLINSYKYGFILRYPSDKVEVTKVSYEPWHYRYVGKNAAKEMYEGNLTLEEYIESLK